MKFLGNKGNSFTEYALLIGIIFAALMSMNVYASRGIQGKVKDLTDHYIGAEQLGEISPNTKSDSVSNADMREMSGNNLYFGGSTQGDVSGDANTTIHANSTYTTADTRPITE